MYIYFIILFVSMYVVLNFDRKKKIKLSENLQLIEKTRNLEAIMEIRQKITFLEVINKPIV